MNTNINAGAQTPQTPSKGTTAQESVIAEILRPRWCIQRDDNTVVPLIALDELPDSVTLKDVPITVTILEALRARMELIPGEYPARGVRYQLHQPINAQTVANQEGDDSGSDSSPGSAGSEGSTHKDSASDKTGNKNEGSRFQDKALRTPTLTTNDNGILDTMAKKGTMGKKIYCTYWIQTGNCNYMQEGCKYRHEIPNDEETRRAIGFREIPNWPREELPAHTKPVQALHKAWRRQDGKPVIPSVPGSSKGAVASPASAHRAPVALPHGNRYTSPGARTGGSAFPTQHNPSTTAFAAPHQHFPTHANLMAQQRPFSQGGQSFLGNGAPDNYHHAPAQNKLSPPSYHQAASQIIHGRRSGSSSPAKQPPISRPTNLGQSSAGQQQGNKGASTQKVAPDFHHPTTRASGLSAGVASPPNGNQTPNNARPTYSGMPGNWNPQTNAPTSMDISFIAPASASTRSGSQPIYTPTYTSTSNSATPTLKNANGLNTSNGNTTPDARAAAPATYNNNAFANNATVPVKGRGPIQYSPAPSTASARNTFQTSTAAAEESDATSIMSPPIQHRVFFREPGQPEFVTNPPEPKSSSNGKAAYAHGHGPKKHAKKVHGVSGGKGVKGKMGGGGFDLLVDTNEQ